MNPDLVRAWANADQRCAATRQGWELLRHNGEMREAVIRRICGMQRDGIRDDDLVTRMVGCLAEYAAVVIVRDMEQETKDEKIGGGE